MILKLAQKPLAQQVKRIIKSYGGSLYVPSPANCFQDSAGTTPCTVDSPVGYLKDLTGTNHATQATAGYKPILRGAVKNLTLYSCDFANSYWGSSLLASRISNTTETLSYDMNYTAGKITAANVLYGGLLRHYFDFVTGVTYSLQVKVKKNNHRYIGLRIGNSHVSNRYPFFDLDTLAFNSNGVSINSYNIKEINNGWYIISITYTSQTTATLVVDIAIVGSDGASSITPAGTESVYVDEVQFEIGSTASPYVPTTTTAASSSYGPYWLDFDGVDDRLDITVSSACGGNSSKFIVASFITINSTDQALYFIGTSVAGGAFALGVYPSMPRSNIWQYGGASYDLDSASSAPTIGVPCLLSGTKVNNTLSLRKNTILNNSATLNAANVTTLTGKIGCVPWNSLYYKGVINCIMVGVGAIPESQLKKLEKYAGKLAGLSL